MSLDGHVFTGAAGSRGFDANRRLTPKIASDFHAHGYAFCVRYVRRHPHNAFDLTAKEASDILAANLGLMVVQHVAKAGWLPDGNLGVRYGAIAAAEAQGIGVPPGVTLWCDLEEVGGGVKAASVIDYCNEWHRQVASAGFIPGLYVGFGAGLSAAQLYKALRFTHYWGAYNLNADQVPIVRGLQMRQTVPSAQQRVPGYDFEFQVDSIAVDALGGLPTLLGPESWLT
jgi:hypothetical protein